MATTAQRIPWWAWTWPLVAGIVLVLQFFLGSGGPLAATEVFAVIATVFAAVYHAEVVACRVGEPFGTLVLALAVTIIEVALIVSMMITGGPDKAALARINAIRQSAGLAPVILDPSLSKGCTAMAING